MVRGHLAPHPVGARHRRHNTLDTASVPWVAPRLAELGDTPEMVGVRMVMGTGVDQRPSCCTWALPDCALAVTLAAIRVSLRLTIVAGAVPSQMEPLPCLAPKFEPLIVICVPAVGAAAERPVTEGTAP